MIAGIDLARVYSKVVFIKKEGQNMQKYRLICPECSAIIVTASPDSLVWELCPACRRHMWDVYDARMADKVVHEARADERSSNAAN